jgi:hypothetical protein
LGKSSSLRSWWRRSQAGATRASQSTARSKPRPGKRPSEWENT